ncbi:n-acetyltransferase p20 [Fusarium heterosporum]|uniref:N-acetyltransferase p20 n=1 Tax=Fusarium heterosporum TaxID=42747 RepID=A0A8H5SM61_FUSHE|nr:n-acetyltransferase p20 [Fusarium heterosporum]
MRNTFPSPYNLSNAEWFLANMACKPDGTSYPRHSGIFLKPNTTENPSSEPLFVGAVGTMPNNDIYFRVWEIGYWFAEEAWGKGYATEAVRGFVKWCFETWPELNRFDASSMRHNKGSQNVLTKSGFVREGNRRGSVFKNGEFVDEIQFGLLRDELK